MHFAKTNLTKTLQLLNIFKLVQKVDHVRIFENYLNYKPRIGPETIISFTVF